MLVGITGYAQHGKDTIASVLCEDFGFERVAFADALKWLAFETDPYIPGIGRLQHLVGEYGWESAKQWPEVRRLLQDLGTSARDILGADVWVRAAELAIANTPSRNIVISDCRFPNEFEYVKRHSGKLWRVLRPGFDNGIGTTTESERHVADAVPDLDITNNYENAAVFQHEVRKIAAVFLEREPA